MELRTQNLRNFRSGLTLRRSISRSFWFDTKFTNTHNTLASFHLWFRFSGTIELAARPSRFKLQEVFFVARKISFCLYLAGPGARDFRLPEVGRPDGIYRFRVQLNFERLAWRTGKIFREIRRPSG